MIDVRQFIETTCTRVWFNKETKWERERERERHRHTDRQTDRKRDRDRETGTHVRPSVLKLMRASVISASCLRGFSQTPSLREPGHQTDTRHSVMIDVKLQTSRHRQRNWGQFVLRYRNGRIIIIVLCLLLWLYSHLAAAISRLSTTRRCSD